ncbi:MAG: hypothetical protein ACTHMM_05815 [Agriterribacter sp.]
MKKAIGILFVSIYMLAFTEFHQLLKIPFMMEHFKKHQLADPNMTFGSFIKMHYLGPIIITDDFQQDQQLPFRDMDSHMMNTSVCACNFITVQITPPSPSPHEFHCYDEINKPQFSSFDIFQPPRIS